jgi:hypothetical protein
MAAVQQEALKSYTKHEAIIHSRFQWLKDPANEVTRVLDAEDVRGLCRQSWHQPASSRNRLADMLHKGSNCKLKRMQDVVLGMGCS